MSSPQLSHPGRVKYNQRLRTERTAPFSSLPGTAPDYQPPNSYKSDRFTDEDDWYTIAGKYNVPVDRLIQFNFNTTNPDVVNHWLHVLVGCDTATADLTNWKFSSTAKRPWVYVPYVDENQDPTVVVAPTAFKPISLVFQGPGDWIEKWLRENCNKPGTWGLPKNMNAKEVGKWLKDTVKGGQKGLIKQGIKNVGLMFACALSDMDPIMNLIVPAFKQGVGLGFVLGADQRRYSWWRLNNDYSEYPSRFGHPEYGLQDAMNNWYKRGLEEGADRGWKLSKSAVETRKLFVWLKSQMSTWTIQYAGFDQRPMTDWSSKKWSDYYHICGRIMETKIIIQ